MGSLVLSAGSRWGERLQQQRVATSAAPHNPSNSAGRANGYISIEYADQLGLDGFDR